MTTSTYKQGYEDERFEPPVEPKFHCSICRNVLKDPVMCRNNKDCFCRPCIIRHLTNFNSCPTCMEELTPETLSPVSRLFKQRWSELNIRCNFYNRGCHELVQLGDLEMHLVNCGFAPVKSSNEGCHVGVDNRVKPHSHHENGNRQLGASKCYDYDATKQEISGIKNQIVQIEGNMNQKSAILPQEIDSMKAQIAKLEQQLATLSQLPQNIDEMMVQMRRLQQQLATVPKPVQETNQISAMRKRMTRMEEQILREAGQTSMTQVTEIHGHMTGIQQQETGVAQDISCVKEKATALQEQMMTVLQQKIRDIEMSETTEEVINYKVIVAGGKPNSGGRTNTVEMFDSLTASWTLIQPMKETRSSASSFLYQNQFHVTGGMAGKYSTDNIETIRLNSLVNVESWFDSRATLPLKVLGHTTTVHNERLIVTGGYDGNKACDTIYEVLLVSPYSKNPLTRMKEARCYHAAELVDDQMFIFGGTTSFLDTDSVDTVIKYDIVRNECSFMAPLPYAVNEMAIVRRGDDVILLGGVDRNDEALDSVIIYNVKTGNSNVLPNMRYKRRGCVAVNVGNNIVVIGGKNTQGHFYKSVERFDFERNVWQDLPPMNEVRWLANAVAC